MTVRKCTQLLQRTPYEGIIFICFLLLFLLTVLLCLLLSASEFDSIATARGGADEGAQARRLLTELLLQLSHQKKLQQAQAREMMAIDQQQAQQPHATNGVQASSGHPRQEAVQEVLIKKEKNRSEHDTEGQGKSISTQESSFQPVESRSERYSCNSASAKNLNQYAANFFTNRCIFD